MLEKLGRIISPLVLLAWYLLQESNFLWSADMIPQGWWGLGLVVLSAGVTAAWFETVRGKLWPEWPDFEKWDKVNEFKLYQVAALWINKEPKPLPMRGKVLASYNSLAKDMRELDLPVVNSDSVRQSIENAVRQLSEKRSHPYSTETVISRNNLEKLSALSHEKPRFLYQWERDTA